MIGLCVGNANCLASHLLITPSTTEIVLNSKIIVPEVVCTFKLMCLSEVKAAVDGRHAANHSKLCACEEVELF